MSAYDNIKGRLTLAANMVEGSYGLDNAAAVGEEIDRVDADIEFLPNRFFPLLASGDDLTTAASNWGIDRAGATAATAVLTITGTAGAIINGEIYATSGTLLWQCGIATIGSNGKATVTATCMTEGAVGNVPVGAITEWAEAYDGLDTVTNAQAASGGTDTESDDDLLARVMARWSGVSQSGNKQDYLNWALSVDGVSKAKIMRQSAHPGHVYIYIIGSGNAAASSDLVATTQQYIDSVHPIGAIVEVSAAQAESITIVVSATLKSGYTAASVKASMEDAVSKYLASFDFTSTISVSYLRLADLLFVDGVGDISSYTLNGGTTTVTLAENQFPILGGVTVGS